MRGKEGLGNNKKNTLKGRNGADQFAIKERRRHEQERYSLVAITPLPAPLATLWTTVHWSMYILYSMYGCTIHP
jgi:hypothetical protein